MRQLLARLFTMLAIVGLLAACAADEPPPAPAPPPAPLPAPAPPANAAAPLFSGAELEQMLAPIALFPDPLLAQVLMAATYPGEVADAAAWSRHHPDANGDSAVRQVGTQPWDPSVQGLVAFPQVLAMLGRDPAWVQRLGDAFLADPDAVLDAVQRLRRRARDAGNLASNEYIDVEPVPGEAGGDDFLAIESTNADFVHVPEYDPGEAYGDWIYDDYPPVYYPGSPVWYPGTGLGTIIRWGVGIAISDALWSRLTWGGDSPDIRIDINAFNAMNRETRGAGDHRWQHDGRHRDGVPYRDAASRERYGRQLADASHRDGFRGDEAGRVHARIEARATRRDAAAGSAAALAPARLQATPESADAAAADYAERAARGEIAIRPTAQEQLAEDRRLAEAATRDQANAEWERQRRAEIDARQSAEARLQASSREPMYGNAFAGAHRPADSRAGRDRGERSRNEARRETPSAPARPVSRPVRTGGARGGRGR